MVSIIIEKGSRLDRFPDLLHEMDIVIKIVEGVQSRRQDFPGQKEMPKISPGIVAAGIAGALFINRLFVLRILGLLNGYLSAGSEEGPIPGISCGKDTVEEINAEHLGIQDILGGSDPH